MNHNKSICRICEVLKIESRIRNSTLLTYDLSYLQTLNNSCEAFPRSLFLEGLVYLKGIRVKKNMGLAYQYFTRAKEKGADYIQLSIVKALITYDDKPNLDFILDCIKKAKEDAWSS